MGMACLALKSSELWWSDYDDHDDATCILILALASFMCVYSLVNLVGDVSSFSPIS